MTKKEAFLKIVKTEIFDRPDVFEENYPDLFSDALDYYNGLLISGSGEKPKFTETGRIILMYMRDNREQFNNLFKAKEVGEGLGVSSRTASGSMRKLVMDGYLEKVGESPTVYSVTSLGLKVDTGDNEVAES